MEKRKEQGLQAMALPIPKGLGIVTEKDGGCPAGLNKIDKT